MMDQRRLGYLSDLSKTGCHFLTDQYYKLDETLALEIDTQQRVVKLLLKLVRRSRKSDCAKHEYGYGAILTCFNGPLIT
jgi:hypothetical protein